MAPKRGTKRSFEATELEDSASLPKQTTLSRAGRVVRASTLPTPTATSSPEPEEDDTTSKAKKKPAARKTAGRKPAPKSAPKSAPKKAPTAGKLYEDGIKEVDKKFYQLHKKYKPNPTEWSGITADDFASSMWFFLPKVKELREQSVPPAFNLLLDIGEHAYGDLDACMKAGGFGETGKPYKAMDSLLVELITARKVEEEGEGAQAGGDGNADQSEGPKFVLEPSTGDVDVNVKRVMDGLAAAKKKRPNKQERGWLDRARKDDLKELFETRRERREAAEDWVGNALNDLVETRKRIDAYGVEGYFRESIALLASMKGVDDY